MKKDYYKEVLTLIASAIDSQKVVKKTKEGYGETYLGTRKTSCGISIPKIDEIVKKFAQNNRNIEIADFEMLLNKLYESENFDEIMFAGKLINAFPKLRKEISPEIVENWLDNLEGWAEVDSLCQPNFTAKEMLDNWDNWEVLLKKLNKDKNINKRRASLVLLTKPARQTNDEKIMRLAINNIDALKHEKEILITKAISWLLRSMIKNYRSIVEDYLKNNKGSLPAIAIRETQKKLLTGKK